MRFSISWGWSLQTVHRPCMKLDTMSDSHVAYDIQDREVNPVDQWSTVLALVSLGAHKIQMQLSFWNRFVRFPLHFGFPHTYISRESQNCLRWMIQPITENVLGEIRAFVVLFNGLFLRKSRSHLGVKRVAAGMRDKRRHWTNCPFRTVRLIFSHVTCVRVFRSEAALRYIHMIHICVFVSICIYYYEAFGFAGTSMRS